MTPFDLPPKLEIPKPSIIRLAEHSLLRPGAFRAVSRAERREIISDLVRAKRLTPAEARHALLFVPVVGWPAGAAAFPVVEGRQTTLTGSMSSHVVNLDSAAAAGELILVIGSMGGGFGSVAWGSGGTELEDYNGIGGDNNGLVAGYYTALGSETSVTVTSGNNRPGGFVAYRISGWNAVEIATRATGNSTSPNPPSLSPSWGAKKTLWIACSGLASGGVSFTNAPTNYINLRDFVSGSNDSRGGSAERENEVASENPGVFTISGSQPWAAQMIAVEPG